MKSPSYSLRAAFTLMELLIVIGIIALLASISIPVAVKVMENARKAQAKAAMAGLVIGIQNYRTDYNRLPALSGTGSNAETPIALTAGNTLLPMLHPDRNAAPPAANPKRNNYYDAPPAKGNAGGLTADGSLNDPWGHPYRVIMDYDDDGSIADPTGSGGKIQSPVILYSTGPPAHPPVENTDSTKFVCSWK